MEYSCDKCKRVFKRQCDLLKHNKRKTPCTKEQLPVDNAPQPTINNIQLETCPACKEQVLTSDLGDHLLKKCVIMTRPISYIEFRAHLSTIYDKLGTLSAKIDFISEKLGLNLVVAEPDQELLTQ